jgi:hypothetical protein
MSDQPQHPIEPSPEHHKDIDEDPHFHDDDELIRQDDVNRPSWRPAARRKPSRKLPTRRHYED